jgi:hypothetical protein
MSGYHLQFSGRPPPGPNDANPPAIGAHISLRVRPTKSAAGAGKGWATAADDWTSLTSSGSIRWARGYVVEHNLGKRVNTFKVRLADVYPDSEEVVRVVDMPARVRALPLPPTLPSQLPKKSKAKAETFDAPSSKKSKSAAQTSKVDKPTGNLMVNQTSRKALVQM